MKKTLIAALAATIMSTSAFAQTGDSHNPAVKDPHAGTAAVAAKGRNSFTEAQARGRIGKAGYARVSALSKNENGVWQGKAYRDNQLVNVALDYKGNVTVH